MILFIDTSDNQKLHLSLILKGKMQVLEWKSPNSASETLIDKAKTLLKRAKTQFSKLSKVAVVIGPGHFSRIRTGVTTANALAFSLKIPVIGVRASEKSNFQKIFQSKGEFIVKPFYDRQPNITKPKAKG